MNINGRNDTISIDRLKPAHIDIEHPNTKHSKQHLSELPLPQVVHQPHPHIPTQRPLILVSLDLCIVTKTSTTDCDFMFTPGLFLDMFLYF